VGGRINSFIDIKFLKYRVLRINLLIYLESKYNIYQVKINIIKIWKTNLKNKVRNKKKLKKKTLWRVKETKSCLKTHKRNYKKKKNSKRKVNFLKKKK
jgi:hypothetical protein